MNCPLKLCQRKCGFIAKNWLVILFLVVALVIGVLNLNQKLFFFINNWHFLLPDSVWLGINFVAAPSHFILVIGLLLLTWFLKREKNFGIIATVVIFYLISFVLKKLVGEPRPFMVIPPQSFYWLSSHEQFIGREYASFPSGHVGIAAIFVFSIINLFFQKNKFMYTLLFMFLIIVGLARICTGWHWPLDVIYSGLIGYFIVKICLKGTKITSKKLCKNE